MTSFLISFTVDSSTMEGACHTLKAPRQCNAHQHFPNARTYYTHIFWGIWPRFGLSPTNCFGIPGTRPGERPVHSRNLLLQARYRLVSCPCPGDSPKLRHGAEASGDVYPPPSLLLNFIFITISRPTWHRSITIRYFLCAKLGSCPTGGFAWTCCPSSCFTILHLTKRPSPRYK